MNNKTADKLEWSQVTEGTGEEWNQAASTLTTPNLAQPDGGADAHADKKTKLKSD